MTENESKFFYNDTKWPHLELLTVCCHEKIFTGHDFLQCGQVNRKRILDLNEA